jgi:adenylosuccinate synthase
MERKESLQDWKGNAAVIGVDWGDSGKGRLIDDLSKNANIIARYNGGSNTGHTVKNEKGEFALHMMPSGIFNQDAFCIIGRNVALDLQSLALEMEQLEKAGVSYEKLLIDEQATLTMPWHKLRDGARERTRSNKIGTTGRGVGPTYADRVERVGLMVKDLVSDSFEEKFREEFKYQVETFGLQELDENKILEEYKNFAQIIKPFIAKTTDFIDEATKQGRNILFEGAQGFFLDIDFGTYPFVTSSHPGIVGIWTCFGVTPNNLNEVIGITKAYTTRVGEGPMPTLIEGQISDFIIDVGKERGTTTGRIRRPGWLDLVLLKYAARQNMLTSLAITKMDVLSTIKTLKICVGYQFGGKSISYPPHDADFLSKCEPVYEDLPGWDEPLTDIRKFEDLPENAKKYVKRIEEIVEVPVKFISVGPERGQVIYV